MKKTLACAALLLVAGCLPVSAQPAERTVFERVDPAWLRQASFSIEPAVLLSIAEHNPMAAAMLLYFSPEHRVPQLNLKSGRAFGPRGMDIAAVKHMLARHRLEPGSPEHAAMPALPGRTVPTTLLRWQVMANPER
ncbi:MAG: hypothetical protein ABW190_14750 [Rhizobacter sp.]